MKKDRTIEDLDSYLGNFSREIKRRVNSKNKLKILDAGCGYGLVMAGLTKKFGNKIELSGYNKQKEDGTIKDFKERSTRKGILTKEEIKKINLPKIVYLDANKKLLFKDEEFDFIYSLASVYLYKDKVAFLQECNRILAKGGTARIHLFEIKKDKVAFEDLRKTDMKWYLKIFEDKKSVSGIDYFSKTKGVKIKFGRRKDNGHTIVYLEIKKQPQLDFNLKLIGTGEFDSKSHGFRSIYKIKH